jgi:hypothetical protein
VTSPRIEELPEEVVLAAYDAADACFPSSAQGRWLRPAVEATLQAALSTGRFMLVPKGQVGVVLEREDIEAVVRCVQGTREPYKSAKAKLSQALARVEERDG